MSFSIPPLDFSRSPSSFYTFSASISSGDGRTAKTGSSEQDHLSRISTAASLSSDDACPETTEEPELVRQESSGIVFDIPATGVVHREPIVSGRCDHRKGWKSFRVSTAMLGDNSGQITGDQCDIFPTTGTSYAEIEAELRRSIIAAGGEMDTNFVYPGGFMYRIAPSAQNSVPVPRSVSGKFEVKISTWTPFPKPVFDRFKLQPYHAADRTVTAERRRTIAGPEILLQDMLMARTRGESQSGRKRVVSAWLRLLVKECGKRMSYVV
ncbi:hypothetical protein LTR62_001497 [Meristemomyces frigidus]|uniref:Uncharacterized protein n=1 Tax=Meristemomyces frigidus TaxID=1508187 RepID=A0AAN7YSL0_9PEZI|nr:hypothetical protein LTR62_001497 [Meristemomyces frigidus]